MSRVTIKKLNAFCNRDDSTKDDRKFEKFHGTFLQSVAPDRGASFGDMNGSSAKCDESVALPSNVDGQTESRKFGHLKYQRVIFLRISVCGREQVLL